MLEKLIHHFKSKNLTKSEIECCVLSFIGLSVQELADLRFTGIATIKFHKNEAFKKLGISGKATLSGYCFNVLSPNLKKEAILLFFPQSTEEILWKGTEL